MEIETLNASGENVQPASRADFSAAWWLPGAHLQTVWGRVGRRQPMVALRREIWSTPDGDELHVDVHRVASDRERARAILLHGLEGSSRSIYVHGIAERFARRGVSTWAINFRSCARDPRDPARAIPNHLPRSYHSGETGDLDLVARRLAGEAPDTPLVGVGVSLGGNVLLKWLGDGAGSLPPTWTAAAALSVPYDLEAGARHLERGLGPLYVRSFLTTLKAKLVSKCERFPELRARVDLERALRATTFFEFDDAGTAPVHGFAGASDYYACSSCLHVLDRLDRPVLGISAADDPFLPVAVLEEVQRRASERMEARFTTAGGHVGFVAGGSPATAVYWAEDAIVDWLDQRIEHRFLG